MPSLEFFSLVKRLQSVDNNTIVDHEEEAALVKLMKNALTCTQQAGDIMFVPTLWAHATLNIKQSIGVAHEFSVESFCME